MIIEVTWICFGVLTSKWLIVICDKDHTNCEAFDYSNYLKIIQKKLTFLYNRLVTLQIDTLSIFEAKDTQNSEVEGLHKFARSARLSWL